MSIVRRGFSVVSGQLKTASVKLSAKDVGNLIPMRIKRNPTDLLKALATTVSEDPTAAKFRFVDDPYFIPASVYAKRNYALSKEAGKKTARWMAAEYPTFFMWDLDEPRIPAFRHPKVSADDQGDTEADLLDRIGKRQVNNVTRVYDNMDESKRMALSPEIKLKLMEFLCFCNGQEPFSLPAYSEWSEEKFFRNSFVSMKDNEKPKEKQPEWDADKPQNKLAEKIFLELSVSEDKQTVSAAYSAVVCGYCKHRAHQMAWGLYEEMRGKQLVPSLEAFTGLAEAIFHIREDYEARLSCVKQLLGDMNELKIRPDVRVFNRLLQSLRTKERREKEFLSVYREMTALCIEPSLTTYHHLLQQVQPSESLFNLIFTDIEAMLNSGKDLVARDDQDDDFFVTAMTVVNKRLRKIDVAERIIQILKHPKNKILLSDAYKESLFYGTYLKLLSTSETAEKMMEVYNRIVPNTFTPDMFTFLDVLRNVERSAAYEVLPHLWRDVVCFGLVTRHKLIEEWLRTLERLSEAIATGKEAVEEKNVERRVRIAGMAWDLRHKIDEQYEDPKRKYIVLPWKQRYFLSIAFLCSRAGDMPKAWQMFERLEDFKSTAQPGTTQEHFDHTDQRLMATVALNFATEKDADKCFRVAEFASKSPFLSGALEAIVKGVKTYLKEDSDDQRRFNSLLDQKK